MGYYTYYTLEYEILEPESKSEQEIKFRKECEEKGIHVPEGMTFPDIEFSLMSALAEVGACSYGNLMQFVNCEGDHIKWYDHDVDMKAFSKRFPTVLFTLSGDGEEGQDIWKKYYYNGKMQVAEAVVSYEPFDKSKLK